MTIVKWLYIKQLIGIFTLQLISGHWLIEIGWTMIILSVLVKPPYGGFHSHGGTPKTLDGLYHGKSIHKWMITGGTSILGNLHIIIRACEHCESCFFSFEWSDSGYHHHGDGGIAFAKSMTSIELAVVSGFSHHFTYLVFVDSLPLSLFGVAGVIFRVHWPRPCLPSVAGSAFGAVAGSDAAFGGLGAGRVGLGGGLALVGKPDAVAIGPMSRGAPFGGGTRGGVGANLWAMSTARDL